MAGAKDVSIVADVDANDEKTVTSPKGKAVPNGDEAAPPDVTVRADDAVVRVNAGGSEFVTTAGTLRTCGKGSVPHLLADADNAAVPFLDRDAGAFADVLRWARAARFGGASFPADANRRVALAIEARALRIPALAKALHEDKAARARVDVLVATKTTELVNGAAVNGHYVVAGRRSSAGWFASFNSESLERSFADRVSAAVAEQAARTGLVPIQAHSSAALEQGDGRNLLHILTITYTFGMPP